jgi:hypothetical protein
LDFHKRHGSQLLSEESRKQIGFASMSQGLGEPVDRQSRTVNVSLSHPGDMMQLARAGRLDFRRLRICFTIEESHRLIGAFAAAICLLQYKESPVIRFSLFVGGVLCAWGLGCSESPAPVGKVAKTTWDATTDSAAKPPPDQDEPPLDDGNEGVRVATGDVAAADGFEELELKESGVRFLAPASWKRVTPQNNIIEAEFELPRAEGDEFDGRLTLMSSGGSPQDAIAIRTAEFKIEAGEAPTTEKINVGGYDASLVDIRGEWKGMARQPVPPRAGYRMLLFIIPLGEGSGFYAKLTGPQTTIAAHEESFREFLRSAKITRAVSK